MANEFLPFGIAGGSNVLTNAEYDALTARQSGFIAGVAKSREANKVWRQATFMSAMLGTFIDTYGTDALDNGVIDDLLDSFSNAVRGQRLNYAAAGGTPNALTVTLDPVPPSHAATVGMPLRVLISANNTGAATLNAGPGALPITTLRGGAIARDDLPAGGIANLVGTGTSWMLAGVAYSEVPRVVLGNLTFYVRHDGSNNNDGLANTADRAWQTVQGAIDNICRRYATNSFIAQVNLAPSVTVYAGGTSYRTPMRIEFWGTPGVPTDVTIAQNVPSGAVLTGNYFSDIGIKHLTVNNLSGAGGFGIISSGSSILTAEGINWGTARQYCIAASGLSEIVLSGAHAIFAGPHDGFAFATAGSSIGSSGSTSASVTASQTILQGFVTANGGQISLGGVTWSGHTNAVGPRYLATNGGIITAAGGGTSFYPGTTAGNSTNGFYYP